MKPAILKNKAEIKSHETMKYHSKRVSAILKRHMSLNECFICPKVIFICIILEFIILHLAFEKLLRANHKKVIVKHMSS